MTTPSSKCHISNSQGTVWETLEVSKTLKGQMRSIFASDFMINLELIFN